MTTIRPPAPSPVERRQWWPSRAAAVSVGLVAVALTVAGAELLAALGQWFGLLGTPSSPLNSLGESFIDLTPGWLKQFAVDTFGLWDKVALRVGMVLTIIVLAAAVGLLARVRVGFAVLAATLLLAVALIAIWTRVGSSPLDGLPMIAGTVAGCALLVRAFRSVENEDAGWEFGRLHSSDDVESTAAHSAGSSGVERLGPTEAPTADIPKPEHTADRHPMLGARGLDRRRFFRLVGWSALVAAVSGAVARWIPSTAQVQASRAAVGTAPPTLATASPQAQQGVPAGTELHVNGLTPYLTPNGDFYRIDTALAPPRLRAEDWKLRIHGLVEREVTLDYAQLRARPHIERTITLTCVSNEVGGDLAGNARWIGARLDDLIEQAGPQPGADCVLCTSIDGFTSSTPLEALTDGRDALLATFMNGEPLPIEHGFPVRMVVPGLYGYVSATKWVVDLEVTRFADVSAYWSSRGWSDHGPIKTASRIDVPPAGAQFDPGHRVTIAGVAWAQHRGVQAVEVRIDGGAWQRAELADALSVDTWRQWKLPWTAKPGRHTITCRAIDGAGAVQDDAVRPVAPDGATGYHSRTLNVD